MFFFNDTATTEIYTLSLHDALPISQVLVADALAAGQEPIVELHRLLVYVAGDVLEPLGRVAGCALQLEHRDRKSTRLNSSHANISYAVFCLKKKITLLCCPTHRHRT